MSFELEDGTGVDSVGNAAGSTLNPLEDGGGGDDAIALNESAMTGGEMEDLTYAFQAADMDGGGAIDLDEFSLMLEVMGCVMTDEQVKTAMVNAKAGFKKWCEMADQENVAKCQKIWNEYDEDKSGTMDLGEINSVISALRNTGADIPSFTKEQVDEMSSSGDGELNFSEFSKWYLEQDLLPDEFSLEKKKSQGSGEEKEKGAVGKMASKVLAPLSGMTKQVVSGPAELLKMSARQNATADKSAEGYDEEEAARAMMEEEGEIIFAEFVFMMRGGDLKEFMPGDWQEKAEDMRKLREAFDTADVDGDNQLELEELEMVVVAMNPKADVSPEDIQKVWAVLNPAGKEWIPFSEYVKGMIKVKNDPFLSTVVPMDVPNRFQLLSLLIDTPINEDQEKLIFDDMDPLCKQGIKLLKSMGEDEQSKDDIRKVLDQACAGQLHYLTPAQRASVSSVHYWCVFQAFMIATITCGIAAAWENLMTSYYQTDGAFDVYSSCPDFFADVDDPDGEYYNLSLPSNPGPWNGFGFAGDKVYWESYQSVPIAKWELALDAYRQAETCIPAAFNKDGTLPDCGFTPGDAASCPEPSDDGESAGCLYTPPKNPKGECLPGTCTAFPRNVTKYLELGGNAVMGGMWNATDECWKIGTCTDDEFCPDTTVPCVMSEAECLERPGATWVATDDNPATTEIDESVECWPGECAPLKQTLTSRTTTVGTMMIINISMVVVMIVFELLGLMLTALRSAVLVSKALDLRLTPLNKDRAFVAEMLVRSVFELGDSENNDLGVDAGGGEEAVTRPILVNVAAVLWIKGRVLITGTLFKFFTKMGFNWDAATWLAPWTGPTLAAMLWDAMLCHAIMKGAEVQAIGVTTSVEVGAHAYAHTHAQAHTQHPTLCPPLNLSTNPHSPFVLFCLSRWVP
jgi:Ca2+-binding EF-hand superfamily protein